MNRDSHHGGERRLRIDLLFFHGLSPILALLLVVVVVSVHSLISIRSKSLLKVTTFRIVNNTASGTLHPVDLKRTSGLTMRHDDNLLLTVAFVAPVASHRNDYVVIRIRLNRVVFPVPGSGIAVTRDGSDSTASIDLKSPGDLAVDPKGNLYVADSGHDRIRKISPEGTITTVAGSGARGYGGDGGPATRAKLREPRGVAVDAKGVLYIADTRNHRVRRVDADGVITTVAGGHGELRAPWNLAVDSQDRLFISDARSHRVWRFEPQSYELTLIAGTGEQGYSGDGGPATRASLSMPRGLAVDRYGRVYIADYDNDRIRRVDDEGTITTVVGGTDSVLYGDDGSVIHITLNNPLDVAVDRKGRLYIADTGNRRIVNLVPMDRRNQENGEDASRLRVRSR